MMGAMAFPAALHAQRDERPGHEGNELARSWRLELEAGARAWGWRAYRGLYWAPGVWYEVPTGMEVGLFAPLHYRVGARGRAGIDASIGLEPRFRFALADSLRGELAFGIAAEDQELVHGIHSYSAGLNVNDVVSLRLTHERYRLDEGFYDAGMKGATRANYLDVAFTGRTGAAIALAEAAVVILLVAVTSGAS